jgi:DNA-binding NarL/FixJ family response regulator
LVCDEFPLFRRQLVVALEKAGDVEVVGEAPDAEVAVIVAEQLAPDVAFLGLRVPPIGGIRTARRLRHLLPSIGLALAIDGGGEGQERDLLRALRSGVTAFVPRDQLDGIAVDVARGLVRRRPRLDALEAVAVLADYDAAASEASGAPRLSLEVRERAMLEALAAGTSLPDAAAALGVSLTTGSNLVTNALLKLHRHFRTTGPPGRTP